VDGAADPEKEHRRRGLTLVILRLCRGWMLRDTQRRVADSITSDTRKGSDRRLRPAGVIGLLCDVCFERDPQCAAAP
jgi:hypothetical protein